MIAQADQNAELVKLRETHEAARLRLEISQMEQRQAAEKLAGSLVQEAWGARVDPLEYIYDDPRFGTPRFLGSDYAEIEHGKQGILYENEQELAEMRGIGRVLGGISPGKGIVRNLTNFTIGTGFAYTVQAREHCEPPDGLVEALQAVVDDFLTENKWCNDLDRELRGREEVDGEWFLALYATHNGHTQARVIEPEQVTEPREKAAEGESWAFGVITAANDTQDVRGYCVQWEHNGPLDIIPANSIVHSKNNVPRSMLRGVSSFRAVWEELLDARKVRRNTAKGSAVQAAIAWIEEMASGVSQSQVESYRNNNATMRFEHPNGPGAATTSRYRNFEQIKPGTRLRVENGRKFHPGPLGSERAPNFLAVTQACERASGATWCMPEYMVTGDASNANYASTMVAESPFVKHCEVEQERIAADHRSVLWVAVRNAYRAGRFSQFGLTLQRIKRLVEIAVDPPRVATRDEQAATQRRETLSNNGILSDETWSNLEELDYDEEQKRGAKKKEVSAWPVHPQLPTREARLERAAQLLWEGYP